jgi:hypothetical protein
VRKPNVPNGKYEGNNIMAIEFQAKQVQMLTLLASIW